MLLLDLIAEQRIREAQDAGQLDDLPGTGRPVELDDAPFVPEELRVAYRILKNAGYLPPEVEALREMRELEGLVIAADGTDRKAKVVARLNDLRASLDGRHRRSPGSIAAEAQYLDQILERLGDG
jgi:hypothetical protein